MKESRQDRLADAIELLAGAFYSLSKRENNRVILHRLAHMERNLMSQISDYSLRVNTAFDAIGSSVDAMVDSIAGVAGDIAELKRLIDELQTSSGVISPEDQSLLDALESKVNSLVARTETVKTSLADLDAQTSTVPPPVIIPPTEPTVTS